MAWSLAPLWSRAKRNEISGILTKGQVTHPFSTGFKGGSNKMLKSYHLRGCEGNKEKWFKILASLHFEEKERWHVLEHTDLRNGCWGHSLPWDQDQVQRFFSGNPDSWGKARFPWYPSMKAVVLLKFLTVRIPEPVPVSLSLDMLSLSLVGMVGPSNPFVLYLSRKVRTSFPWGQKTSTKPKVRNGKDTGSSLI